MATEQQEKVERVEAARPPESPKKAQGGRWGWAAALGLIVAAGAGGFFFMGAGGEQKEGDKSHSQSADKGHEEGEGTKAALKVAVIKPKRGGMERTTDQPGTIRSFEFAPLYSKVSGYVTNLTVDRGTRVKKGQLLLEVYDPERDVAVTQATAAVDRSKAQVVQAESRVKVAVAAVDAAKAKQMQAKAIKEEMEAKRGYREKQYSRISDLAHRNAIEQRLVDEQYDDLEAAKASVNSAIAGIATADAEYVEAKANVDKTNADLKAAEAEVEVSVANRDMAVVWQKYTKIESPYDGVVTDRGDGVHNGSFIRAAVEGGTMPLLVVARTDLFRTIVLVPDCDSVYCKVGDTAIIKFDAFLGRNFEGKVSRLAESEDLKDRNMRVEIDLPNKDGSLRDGMWGRAVILLEKMVKTLTIPSSCIIDRNGKGEAKIMVVKDNKIHLANILVGIDNGLRVEVISGLTEADAIILRPDASVAEGTKVEVELSDESKSTYTSEH